jgi:hypothetical protein
VPIHASTASPIGSDDTGDTGERHLIDLWVCGSQAFKTSNKKAQAALEEVVRHTERLDNSGRLHTEVAEVTRWIREVDTLHAQGGIVQVSAVPPLVSSGVLRAALCPQEESVPDAIIRRIDGQLNNKSTTQRYQSHQQQDGNPSTHVTDSTSTVPF